MSSPSPVQDTASDASVERPETAMARVRKIKARQVVPFAALLLIIVAFSSAPNFLSIANLDSILRDIPILVLIALGQTFVILTGGIDLSLPGTITLTGGISALLVVHVGEVGLLAAPICGLLIGLANGLIIAKMRLPSFLVTLGTMFVLTGLAQIVTGGVPIPFTSEIASTLANSTISIGALDITLTTIITAVIAGLLIVFALRTRPGRYIYAIGGGEIVARLSGVRIDRYKVLAFGLSGALGGLAGLVLITRALAATPTMGDPFLLTSIAAVVVGGTSLLGGIGGPHWTILGALVISVLDNGMTIAGIDPSYQTVIRGLVIIVASALTLRRIGVIK